MLFLFPRNCSSLLRHATSRAKSGIKLSAEGTFVARSSDAISHRMGKLFQQGGTGVLLGEVTARSFFMCLVKGNLLSVCI